ncbi:hypothetical protein BGW80DRAFT_1374106 [Lactifluus volemus]|nr:hypothetical protein BGW80DRAFT_1374106 [Lactifluus volemus]
MMFMKTILSLSFAALAFSAPTPQGPDPGAKLGGIVDRILYGVGQILGVVGYESNTSCISSTDGFIDFCKPAAKVPVGK